MGSIQELNILLSVIWVEPILYSHLAVYIIRSDGDRYHSTVGEEHAIQNCTDGAKNTIDYVNRFETNSRIGLRLSRMSRDFCL